MLVPGVNDGIGSDTELNADASGTATWNGAVEAVDVEMAEGDAAGPCAVLRRLVFVVSGVVMAWAARFFSANLL